MTLAKTVNIPISFIESKVSWATKGAFVELKEIGPIIEAGDCPFDRRRMRILMMLGWVNFDGKRYFLRSWRKVDRRLNGDGRYAMLCREQLRFHTKETLYMAAVTWLVRIQPNSPTGAGARASKGRLQYGEHTGGVASSLVATFFGKSKSWASGMRRKCSNAGLGFWERRRYEVSREEYEAAMCSYEEDRVTSPYVKAGDKYFREVASKVDICIKCSFKKWRGKEFFK